MERSDLESYGGPLKLGDKLRETKSDSNSSVSGWVRGKGNGINGGPGKSGIRNRASISL